MKSTVRAIAFTITGNRRTVKRLDTDVRYVKAQGRHNDLHD